MGSRCSDAAILLASVDRLCESGRRRGLSKTADIAARDFEALPTPQCSLSVVSVFAWRASPACRDISGRWGSPRTRRACCRAQPSLCRSSGRSVWSSRLRLPARAAVGFGLRGAVAAWRGRAFRPAGDAVFGGEGASIIGGTLGRHKEGLIDLLVGHHTAQFAHRFDANLLVPGPALDDRRGARGLGGIILERYTSIPHRRKVADFGWMRFLDVEGAAQVSKAVSLSAIEHRATRHPGAGRRGEGEMVFSARSRRTGGTHGPWRAPRCAGFEAHLQPRCCGMACMEATWRYFR